MFVCLQSKKLRLISFWMEEKQGIIISFLHKSMLNRNVYGRDVLKLGPHTNKQKLWILSGVSMQWSSKLNLVSLKSPFLRKKKINFIPWFTVCPLHYISTIPISNVEGN